MSNSSPLAGKIIIFLFLLVFVIPFLAGGGIALVYGLMGLVEGYQSKSWPVVEGIIIESDIQKRYHSDGDRVYKAEVNYQYTYQDQEYVGTRIHSVSFSSDSVSSVNKLLKKYPVDMDVDVFVNPDNPEKSLLVSGAGFHAYLIILFGVIFSGVGIFLSIFLPRRILRYRSRRK